MKYNAADFLLQYFHSQYHFKSIHHEKHPFIVGSLRKDSFNRQLAKEAENYLAGKAEITHLDYTDVPFVNQDIEYPAPAAVIQLRETVAKADGIWIFTPEYNFSYPGHLKNVLSISFLIYQ